MRFQNIRSPGGVADRQAHPGMAIRNDSGDAGEATLYIYDVIDKWWGISASAVIEALATVSDATVLHVRINSPGGDVFEGQAIQQAIKRFSGRTIAHIDSLAASAASSIALAADEVEISDGAFFMIHNASTIAWGDKTALRETADLLEKIEGGIVQVYVDKTGQSREQVVAWMDAETWFDADEAVEHGFADRKAPARAKGDDSSTSNAWHLQGVFRNAPAVVVDPALPSSPAPRQRGGPDARLPAGMPALTDWSAANANAARLAALGEINLRQQAAARASSASQAV